MSATTTIQVIEATQVERCCGMCGKTFCLLTDLPERGGETYCALCLIRLRLMKPWMTA